MSFYLVFKEPAIKYSPAYSISWVPVVNPSSPRMCVCVCCVSLTLSQPTLSSAPTPQYNHQVWPQIYWASALLLTNATSPWLDLGIGRYDLACSMLGLLNSWYKQELRKLWRGWKNRMSTLYRTRKSALCILMLDSNSIYFLYPKATEDKMWPQIHFPMLPNW